MVTPEHKARMRSVLEEALRVVESLSVSTPCSKCEEFDKGFCQKWLDQVPADVQSKGCESFMERIPF